MSLLYLVFLVLLSFISSLSAAGIFPDETNDVDGRPSYLEYAKMARYLVHKSNWTSMGTVSSLPELKGFPMVNVIAVADSPIGGESTGDIYFMLTDLDFTGQDLAVDNKLTVLFSEDQDLACTNNGTDPMEPVCARVVLTGKAIKLDENSKEFIKANEAFSDRHPASLKWRRTHAFYLCKMDIDKIAVLDFYGGPHYITPEDYYNANFDRKEQHDSIAFWPKIHWPSVIQPTMN